MIIGLVGLIGSGKGTAGEILEQHGFARDSFAHPVKDALSCIFGWSRKLLEGDTEESRLWRETPDTWWSEKFGYEVSPRNIMQLFGTEACRNIIDENIWVYSLERRIGNRDIVITDVRFPNELNWIEKMGGIIIEIKRGDDPEWYEFAQKYPQLMKKVHPNVHESEWSVVGYPKDYIIRNDAGFRELEQNLLTTLQDIRT